MMDRRIAGAVSAQQSIARAGLAVDWPETRGSVGGKSKGPVLVLGQDVARSDLGSNNIGTDVRLHAFKWPGLQRRAAKCMWRRLWRQADLLPRRMFSGPGPNCGAQGGGRCVRGSAGAAGHGVASGGLSFSITVQRPRANP